MMEEMVEHHRHGEAVPAPLGGEGKEQSMPLLISSSS